jgi:hypothetical protein
VTNLDDRNLLPDANLAYLTAQVIAPAPNALYVCRSLSGLLTGPPPPLSHPGRHRTVKFAVRTRAKEETMLTFDGLGAPRLDSRSIGWLSFAAASGA